MLARQDAGVGVDDETRKRGIDVIDTGPGIPEEIRDRIWEVYFSRKRQGSGLGLPTARKIIEAHGGRIDVQSDVGRGTKFTLEFPTPKRIA